VVVVPTRDGGDYVVADVQVANPSPFDVKFEVSVSEGRASVRFGWPRITSYDPIPSAELTIRYGDDVAEATTNEWPAVFDVALPFSTDRPGSVLILVRDGDGKVVGAQGSGLPASNGAAEWCFHDHAGIRECPSR
jgi:hypothetical protein